MDQERKDKIELSEEVRASQWHHLLDRATQRLRAIRHRRRRALVMVAAGLVVLLVGTYLFYTSDRQIKRLAENYLGELFHGDVHIHSANFSFFGGIELDDIRVVLDDSANPIFVAKRVYLTHDPLALLLGRLKVRQIEATKPKIRLQRHDQQWNFQKMFPPREPDQPPAQLTTQTPVVYVDQGELTVVQFEQGVQVHEHNLRLSGVIQPSSIERGVFQFFASDLTSAGIRGNITAGEIDVPNRRVSFEGRATNVELSEALAETLPQEARAAWRKFRPTGSVSVKVAFNDRQTDQADFGFHVKVSLNGVSLTYTHQGQRFDLRDMTGRCEISRDRLTLVDVHGMISSAGRKEQPPGGSPRADEPQRADPPPSGDLKAQPPVALAFNVSGTVTGIGTDRLGHNLTVSIDDMDLERVGETASGLSAGVASFYRNFKPTGRGELKRLRIVKPRDPGAATRYSGDLVVRDAGCRFRRFPYPVEQISGTIHFGPQGITFDGLKGRQGGARIVAKVGRVTNPGRGAGVDLVIQADDLPLDKLLKEALKERGRGYLDVFESLQPKGKVRLVSRLHRPPGVDRRYEAVNEITLTGTEICYKDFPYRLTDASGTILIEGPVTRIIGVEGRHGPARIKVAGRLENTAQGSVVDLKIDGTDVPLDEELASALPAKQGAAYRSFHPSGRANMTVSVTRNAETGWQTVQQADIELIRAGIVFEDFPYPVEDISGHMRISPGEVVLENLSGTNAEAAITATGSIRVTDESYAMDLTLRGNNVLLDRDLRGALALQSQRLWNDLQPSGRVDVVCRLTKEADPKSKLRTRVVLKARDVSLAYKRFPYPIQHARGQLEFDGSKVTIRQLVSRDKGARLEMSGSIDLPEDGSARSDLTLRVAGLQMDEQLRRAVPKAFAEAMESLRVRGRLNVNLRRLQYNVAANGEIDATWTGSAVVDNAEVNLGVPADRVVAYLELSGSYRNERLAMEGSVTMPQGRIDGKEITNLRAHLVQKAGSRRIVIDRLEGDFYGGRFGGKGQIVLGSKARYDVGLVIRDVDFKRFVAEGMQLDAPVGGGRMSGELVIRSRTAGGNGVRAHGEFRVSQAQLYRLPAVAQMLNVLSLQPGNRGFEEAEISFFVHRGAYIFERIFLKGGAVSLYGSGRMERDGRLNLVFKTADHSPGGMFDALAELAAGLQHELLVVEVTGTMGDPVVRRRSLTTLGAPLKELIEAINSGRKDRQQEKRLREARRK
ncbi:MAG: hypothetical protein GWP05_05430 [Anaerolineaceae bacterium]|nr:hypothetical protein [Anaerolineaceae bacterium]